MGELEPGDDEDETTRTVSETDDAFESDSGDDESDSGDDVSESDSGDDESESDSGDDVSESDSGDDESDSGDDVSESDSGDDVSESDSIDDEFSSEEDDASEEDGAEDEDEDDAFGEERELCPDETCVGVVNARGVCGECGHTSTAASSANVARSRRDSNPGEAVDLMHRSLCPDGSCIGLLGPDGRCKVCGLVGESVYTDPRLRGLKTPAIEDEPEEPNAPEAKSLAPAADGDDASDEAESAGEFADRRLCPDGACIGIIGPAGTCNECGTVL